MTISTATHPKLLWPGLYDIWHDGMYAQWPELYSKVFDVKSSDKHYEEIQGVTSFGLAPQKTQGAALIYDTENQGYLKRFTHVAYALGTQVTKEENADNLYSEVGGNRVKMLGRSMQETVETVAFNHFNRATNTSYLGADGKELLATDHPNVNGGTWQNELTTAADLSETSLEDICILMSKATNDRGLKANIKPKTLLVAPDEMFNAKRIIGSDLQNDTALNAKNILKSEGYFSGGPVVSPYLTDSDAWFVITDVENGMTFFWRTRPEMDKDVDFNTKNLLFSSYMRFSSGWVDARGVYGSTGAA